MPAVRSARPSATSVSVVLGASGTTRLGSASEARAEPAGFAQASASRAAAASAAPGRRAATSVPVVGHEGVGRLPQADLAELRPLQPPAHALPRPDRDVL